MSDVSLVSKEECTSLEQRKPHFSGDASPPPISEDDSSQNACLPARLEGEREEEKAGLSAAAAIAIAIALNNVPIYLPAAIPLICS